MMLARLAICSALLFASGAEAQFSQSYHLIDKAPAGVGFVDGSTFKRSGTHASVWLTLFFFEDNAPNGGAAFQMAHDEVDCAGDRSRHLALINYDAKGKMLAWIDQAASWVDVIPGSNQALELKFACDAQFLSSDRAISMETLQMLKRVRELRGAFH